MVRRNPWSVFLGHCPVVTEYLSTRPASSLPWVAAHGINTFLRAVGQPAFVDNPLLGLLILIAIFLPHPQVGLGCILGGGLATVTELVLGLHPWGLVTNGVAAFNGVLVGTVIPILFPLFYGAEHHTIPMWVCVGLGGVASVFVASAFNNFLGKFSVPYMALPFNLIATIVFLSLQPSDTEHTVLLSPVEAGDIVLNLTRNLSDSDTELPSTEDIQIDWMGVGRGIVVSMGQVYAINHVPASLVIHLAVLLSSPLLFLACNTGAVLGSLLCLTFLQPEDFQQVYDGIWGYNSLLSMAAVSCVFFPFTPASLTAGTVNALSTLLVQAALRKNMDTNHLPVFTLPMTLCTLVLLLASQERRTGCTGPPLARCQQMSFPELQARQAWSQHREGREREEGSPEEKAPAMGSKVVGEAAA